MYIPMHLMSKIDLKNLSLAEMKLKISQLSYDKQTEALLTFSLSLATTSDMKNIYLFLVVMVS